jgi:adenylate cyclase
MVANPRTPEIATRITSSEERIEPGQYEIRLAAILQCDVRGFTMLAKSLPATDVIQLLTEYEKRLVPVIQRHGGSINKFMGDGIMATFDAVVLTKTYAADALRAIDELVKCAADGAAERRAQGQQVLTIIFSAAHGQVVFGAVGDETRLEYPVIGDPVNLSAKIEQHNKETGTAALTITAGIEIARGQGFEPGWEIGRLLNAAIVGVADHVDLVVSAP